MKDPLKMPLRTRGGRIRIRKFTAANITLGAALGILTFISVGGIFLLDRRGIDFIQAFLKTLSDLRTMFLTPAAKNLDFLEALIQIGITLGLAFLTTVIGAAIALVLSLFAARNLVDQRIGNVLKAAMAVVHAIPTVLWVLIFAIGAGLGAAAAVVGMTFHTVGYLMKAYSESFEEIDDGVIEALKASGARWWQIVFQAVLPASITYILSWTFVRFEINFVVAVAMGAAAGAGGIGFDLFMASSFYFNLREVGFITWLILISAVALEFFANKLKQRYILNA